MLDLTRLNGETFKLNVLRIEQMQSLPDTTITLISGKKLVVLESEEDVSAQILAIYQAIGLYGQQPETGGEDT